MNLAGRERELLVEGIDRFNEGRFWDAHESWESIWLEAEEPLKRFLQGLIQLAAAYHHFQRGTLSGGIRLVEAAQEKLSGYPDTFLGIDRSEAVRRARLDRDWALKRVGGKTEYPLPSARFPVIAIADGPEHGQ